jgi:hypothetical protein
MCLKDKNSFSVDYAIVAPFGLSSFIFDEIGCLTYSSLEFCAQTPCAAINLREHNISEHDVCEDG